MKWALITGASCGLGLEFAWQLAAEPLGLVLVARREELLHKHAQEIRMTLGVPVEVLPADLSTKQGQQTVAARLQDTKRPVALLVNNAGFGLGQNFINGNWARENEALNVMVQAVEYLSWNAARSMIKGRSGSSGGKGAIINVSSSTAYTAMGTYAAHKTWVRFFSESLASELKGTGVSVTTVCPGLVRTQFHNSAGMDASTWPSWAFISAQSVVSAAIEGARKRKVIVTPSLRYKLLLAVLRVSPRFLVRRFGGAGLFSRAIKP